MASEQVISARISQEFFDRFGSFVESEYGTDRGARTAAVIEALSNHMTAKTKTERIPTSKKVRQLAPLSQHTKARMDVYAAFFGDEQRTSSEAAFITGQSTNNASKRLQELSQQGYIEPSGDYRKSRDSSKRLMVWKRTTKAYQGKP